METITAMIVIICFMQCMFWAIAEVTGHITWKVTTKTISMVGTALCTLYFLKMYNLI